MWSLVSDFLHLVWRFQGSRILYSEVVFHSFLCPSDSPLYGLVYFHPFVSWWTVGCFYFLAVMNNALVNVCVQILGWYMFLVLLGLYVGLGLMGQTASLCLAFWGVPHWSLQWLHRFISPPANVKVLISPHRHQHLLFSLFFWL